MFKKIWKGIGRHKYTFLGITTIALFSLFNFVWFIKTGESIDIKENKDFLFGLLVFRCVIYLTLFVLLERLLKGKTKNFLVKLLAFTVLVYELVVVFNIPTLLIERLGA